MFRTVPGSSDSAETRVEKPPMTPDTLIVSDR